MPDLPGCAQWLCEREAGSGAGNLDREGDSISSCLSDCGGGGERLGDHLVGEGEDPGPLVFPLEAGSAACRVSLVHGGL